jgi:hypothetical protein
VQRQINPLVTTGLFIEKRFRRETGTDGGVRCTRTQNHQNGRRNHCADNFHEVAFEPKAPFRFVQPQFLNLPRHDESD